VDPSQGVIRWSAQRARQHLRTVVAGAIAIPLIFTIAGFVIPIPQRPNLTDRVIHAVEALAVGVIIVLLLALVYAILRAPYEQRKALRAKVGALIEEYELKKGADVWPRIESAESTRQFPGGRTWSQRKWYLILENTGDGIARDVRVRAKWMILKSSSESETDVEILAPHSKIRFEMIPVADDPSHALCSVSWSDDRGQHENQATLSLM
jgi:hypothetical protein